MVRSIIPTQISLRRYKQYVTSYYLSVQPERLKSIGFKKEYIKAKIAGDVNCIQNATDIGTVNQALYFMESFDKLDLLTNDWMIRSSTQFICRCCDVKLTEGQVPDHKNSSDHQRLIISNRYSI